MAKSNLSVHKFVGLFVSLLITVNSLYFTYSASAKNINVKVYHFAGEKELTAFMDSVFQYGITEANLAIKNFFIAAPDDLLKLDSIKSLVS